MSTRRRFISLVAGLAAAPLPPSRAARAQETDPFTPLLLRITGGGTVRPGRVTVDTPRLADNGHSVPLTVRVDSPMTVADHVVSITLLSGRNPRPVMATFHLGPASGRAQVATRVRLAGTQRVLAVARFSDGSWWSGEAEVEVTESACLDAT